MVLSHIKRNKGKGRRMDRKKMQNMFIRCSSGDESRLSGDENLRRTCKERIKRMSNAYVTDKKTVN